mgnify:FL=1
MCGLKKSSKKGPSMFEVYGTLIHSHLQRRNLNVRGLGALDIRTLKPNGQPLDFTKRSDRQEVKDLINRTNPDWVIGSPPCTPFSIWNYGINYKKMDPEKVKKMIAEGQVHLNFVCSLYRSQMRRGKWFLHEHPATAMSWKEERIK